MEEIQNEFEVLSTPRAIRLKLIYTGLYGDKKMIGPISTVPLRVLARDEVDIVLHDVLETIARLVGVQPYTNRAMFTMLTERKNATASSGLDLRKGLLLLSNSSMNWPSME
ncbi:hypothetical protein CRG98_046559 [Punica granatum]|uniref:Uncharacterized protein n=1 Tax=Punica granatum TaxID=22663 RepID=A0A2I0HMR6_PUNGR|nr:hypothetical protein CRG98_046559 [Punica granatum]